MTNIFHVEKLVHGYDQQGVLNIDQLEIKRGEILSSYWTQRRGEKHIASAAEFHRKAKSWINQIRSEIFSR